MESILIGLMYVALYGAIAAIIVYGIIWVAERAENPLPANIQRLMWVVWLIIVGIMLVRLLLSVPRVI